MKIKGPKYLIIFLIATLNLVGINNQVQHGLGKQTKYRRVFKLESLLTAAIEHQIYFNGPRTLTQVYLTPGNPKTQMVTGAKIICWNTHIFQLGCARAIHHSAFQMAYNYARVKN